MGRESTTVEDLLQAVKNIGFAPDRKNANKGTKRGLELLEKSLEDYGAGRSILSDKHGNILAGNKTFEAASEKGFPLREVHTDGQELIVVVRDDLDLEEGTKARELAYADNRVGQVGLEWDLPVLKDDLLAGIDLEKFWFKDELDKLFSTEQDRELKPPQGGEFGEKFEVICECKGQSDQQKVFELLTKKGYTCRILTL